MTIKALYPNVRPSLDLNFARTRALDPRITFTRASTGTFVGSDGLIKNAASGAARFDHNPTTGESLGLLVEEARTNSVLNSINLSPSSVYIGASGGLYTFTPNQTTAPDGTNTAGSIVFTTSRCGFAIQNTGVSSTTITVNLFAKYIPNSVNTHVRIQLAPSGGTNNYGLFNLTNGTFSVDSSVSSVSMTPFPNGWYRCSVTATHSTTWLQNSGDIRIWFHGATPQESPINNTDGTYVWGVQLEAGSFPTSYIPTSGATVTRAADGASITGANFSSWYNQNEGSLLTVATLLPSIPDGDKDYGAWVGKGSDTNTAIRHDYAYSNTSQLALYGPTAGAFGDTATVSTSAKFRRIASAFKIGPIAIAVNGQIATGSTASMPTDADRLFLTGRIGSGLNKTLARLAYYPVRLPDAQLIALTQ